mmetsp:Transcript_23539/g.65440  ORF Transcript_23539/g.65440 Transcript_23539/m.65440 type:complete len:225 (+) Transcript_23539:921-1595(+)
MIQARALRGDARQATARLEVRVLQALEDRGPLARIPLQHAVHHVDGLSACVGHEHVEPRGRALGEAETDFRRELVAVRPGRLRGRAQDGADLVELVRLGRSRKQWPEGVQLCHDASARPQIQRRVVGGATEQRFRGAVPARRHIVCERRPCADLPCKPEVREFHDVPTHEDVFGLHVAVEVTVLVHMVQPLEHLEHQVSNLGFRQLPGLRLCKLIQIGLHVLED